jgi:hypothetical protein
LSSRLIPRNQLTASTALALLVALLLAAPARASINQLSMFMDDNRLLYRGAAVTQSTLDELDALGVDVVRVSVPWRAIAPAHRALHKPASLRDETDPAQYGHAAFANLDRLLRAARRRDIDVLFNVTGGAPIWATGRRRGRPVSLQYKPDPKRFERFVEMLGRRYDGDHGVPRVDLWSVWNEPNQGALLQPQWQDGRPYSPWLYRRLARAAIAGLQRSGHGGDRILLGETAPLGADRRGVKANMRPGLFLRELLCLDATLRPAAGPGCDFARRGPLAVSGYAHHPYSIIYAPDVGSSQSDEITFADGFRLTALLDAAATAGRLPRDLPLWWTEYGWQTDPPDPMRGVTLGEQARWLGQAEQLAWQNPRVAALTQFLLRDDLPRRDAAPGSRRYWGTYQSGLEFADGRRKPAYDAYRLPLTAPAAVSAGAPVALWGRVRAARPGDEVDVQVEFASAGTWEPAGAPVRVTDPGGVFEQTLTASRSGSYRFRWLRSGSGRGARGAGPGDLVSATVPVAVAGR